MLIFSTLRRFDLVDMQARRHYGPERVDAYAGAIFSNLMAITMIIAAAATLHSAGRTEIKTASDAARSLAPLAGEASEELFGVGLLGASLLAAAVLPLATSYAISEMFGFAKGVSLNYRHARSFYNLFTGLVVAGALASMIPNLPVIKLLIAVQALNGALLPIILFFVMRLINDERLTGDLKNSKTYNLLGWGTFALVTSAVAIMLGAQLMRLLS
jgi:Mn2+/Fe2+ NRAMP family transporter